MKTGYRILRDLMGKLIFVEKFELNLAENYLAFKEEEI